MDKLSRVQESMNSASGNPLRSVLVFLLNISSVLVVGLCLMFWSFFPSEVASINEHAITYLRNWPRHEAVVHVSFSPEWLIGETKSCRWMKENGMKKDPPDTFDKLFRNGNFADCSENEHAEVKALRLVYYGQPRDSTSNWSCERKTELIECRREPEKTKAR